jgi:hypothetical protein
MPIMAMELIITKTHSTSKFSSNYNAAWVNHREASQVAVRCDVSIDVSKLCLGYEVVTRRHERASRPSIESSTARNVHGGKKWACILSILFLIVPTIHIE